MAAKNIHRCKNCSKKFYSSKGKEYCKICRNELGYVSTANIRMNARRNLKRHCADIKDYESEIKRLAVKLKYDLIEPLDIYRIVNVYLNVTCDDLKYSTKDPLDQCHLMVAEMLNSLNALIPVKTERKGRKILQLDESGNIIQEFQSVLQAARMLDYCQISIRRKCDGVKVKKIRENLMWKKDFNI